MDYTKIQTTLIDFAQDSINLLPNILAALIVIILAILATRLTQRLTEIAFKKATRNSTISRLLSSIFNIVIISASIIIALRILNLDGAVASLLAGAGIAGLALGFAFQDIAANFIAGIIIALQKPFSIGDIVETNGQLGTVKRISLRMTELESFQGQVIYLPNQKVLLSPLIDFTRSGKRRIDLVIGVGYDSDLENVKEVAEDALLNLYFIDKTKATLFYFTEFADSSINGEIHAWIDYKKQPDFLIARSEVIIAIKKAFDQNSITIPFPIRTIEMAQRG